jgi:hypothetical protein
VLLENTIQTSEVEAVEKFFKFQGINAVLEFLNEYPDIAKFIYEKIKELH